MKKNEKLKDMRRISLFLLFVFSFMGFASAQAPLSETATASLLTCGPGSDFYTTFGHSALRICDTARGIDYVYNYGTFDFDTPHFYWKFMRGKLDYCLSRTSMDHFMKVYASEGRSVAEQRLYLDAQQTSNLFLLLEQNYEPDYRYYRYDFFRDNCATRIRDIVYLSMGHADTLISSGAEVQSYRSLVAGYLDGRLEWWRLGIDILFGLPADHRCNDVECMFLPQEMSDIYDSTIWRGECGNAYIADRARLLLPETRPETPRSFPPVVIFAMLFLAALLLPMKGWWRPWMDRVLFVVAGALGLFLIFMWVGTDHYCTQWNLNILWANPLLILIAIRLERSPRWALWMVAVCMLVAVIWSLWCGLAPAIPFIILTLSMRVGKLLRLSQKPPRA